MSKQARKLRRIISVFLAAVMAVSCFQLSAAAACEESGAEGVSKIMLSALYFLKKSQALYRSHTRGEPRDVLRKLRHINTTGNKRIKTFAQKISELM